jgi:crotonobetainyl-CoA:carnitine CoA-transferase CaiB-like acyl-CoA transferase
MNATPLAGLLVVEIGQFVAAPYAGEVLADLGARVIKIEPPEGDAIRAWGPHPSGESAPYLAYNRGKESVRLDLRSEDGKEAALRLFERADIIVENTRPGVLAKYGLDASAARERNPRLIFCSISGYGQHAPNANRAGMDLVIQANTGIMSVTGDVDGPVIKAGVPIVDCTAALHATTAILAALHAREKSGAGTTIDISLQASNIMWMALLASAYFATGELPQKLGSAHPLSAPYQAFKAADGYITIACSNDVLWETLRHELGLDGLRDDPRFGTNSDRARNQRELAAIVEARLLEDSAEHWVSRLQGAGIPCDRVNDLAQALSDETLVARGTVGTFDHPIVGRMRTVGNPIHFEAPPPPIRRPPISGEHTEAVLREIGLRSEQEHARVG